MQIVSWTDLWRVTFSGPLGRVTAHLLPILLAVPAFAQIVPTEVEIPIQVRTRPDRIVEFNVHTRIYEPPQHARVPNLPPIILTHGIINSDGIVEKLAQLIAREGFTVWTYNQPGFGQHGRVTKAIQQPIRGDYGMTALSGTVGAIAETVSRHTQMKPIFIGYSLGGVALEMYLHGLEKIEEDGRPVLNSRAAVHRQKKLAKAVFISTPALTTEDMPRGLRLLYESARCASCVFGYRDGFLDLGLGRERSLTGKALGLSTRVTPEIVLRTVFQDVTVWENLDPESKRVADYLAKNFSNIHTDLLRDLKQATRHLDDTKLTPLKHVHGIQVVGTQDGIADHRKIAETHRSRLSHNPMHDLILVEGVGHLDILENRVLESGLANDLISRIRAIRKLPQDMVFGRTRPRVSVGLVSCEGSFQFSGLR